MPQTGPFGIDGPSMTEMPHLELGTGASANLDPSALTVGDTKGWPVNNFGILIDVLVRFFTPKVFHSIAQGRRAAAHPG